MVTKWLSLGLLWNFLQMFDWALQVGCMGSYRKFKLTLALGLLQWEKWHCCKLQPGVMFQMVCLGFCLNVSLNNESTNLRVFQIAWVLGYNRITWPFYSSYNRGITGCEYQHWEIHAIKTGAQASGHTHWKVSYLEAHAFCCISQFLSLLALMWSYFLLL